MIFLTILLNESRYFADPDDGVILCAKTINMDVFIPVYL